MTMRRVKDEAINGINPPLFPRVHVNDTKKGGWSRPPPRSTIALCRQSRTLSLPPTTTNSSRSTCIAGGPENNLFIPFCNNASHLKFYDKLKLSSHSVSKSNVTVDSLERKTTKGVNYPSLRGSLSTANKPNSFTRNDYHFKNFPFQNLSSLDYLKVPFVGQSETDSCRERDPQTSMNLSLQLHNSSSKATMLEEKSREYLRNQFEDNSTIPSHEFYNSPSKSELLKRPSAPRNQETICFSQNALNNVPVRENLLLECSGDISAMSSIKVRTQSYNKSPNKPEAVYQHEQVAGVYSHEDVSDCSAMESASGWSTSPNEVVKAIGDKQFWKMRTAMINQQKIFAGQVFELHRLITVQKTLARSPNLLFEGKSNPGKPGTLKDLSRLLAIAPKVKPDAELLKPATEFPEELIIPKFPLPSISKELVTQQCSPTVTNTQPSSPWWFSAPGSQWLVPVVSSSEGLIYKPYRGPSPPTSGFMVPFCNNDTFETAFRLPMSHPYGNSYFPPNATPVVKHANPFAHTQSWSSLSSRVSQAAPVSLRRSQASKDSDIQGSTASSPPERHKRDVLPLFPTEPTQSNAETDEHKQQAPLHAIKTTPHNATSASESAARIFRAIQEERGHSDHI